MYVNTQSDNGTLEHCYWTPLPPYAPLTCLPMAENINGWCNGDQILDYLVSSVLTGLSTQLEQEAVFRYEMVAYR